MSDPHDHRVSPPVTREPDIVINGYHLSVGQAMTVRVAIESFAASLRDGLGNDEMGVAIANAYLMTISGLRRAMYRREVEP